MSRCIFCSRVVDGITCAEHRDLYLASVAALVATGAAR